MNFEYVLCVHRFVLWFVRIYYSNILDKILTQVKCAFPLQSYNEPYEFILIFLVQRIKLRFVNLFL